jgi:enterochelin esterase family protein
MMALLQIALAIIAFQEASAPSNVRGSKFPTVDAEGRVTFRLKAPDAQKVEVKGLGSLFGGKAIPLAKGTDGTWSGTSDPVEPGFYYYNVLVDGVAVNDPGSETFFGWGRETSGLEIPDPSLDFYTVKTVPHGEVRIRTYESKTTGTPRRAYVYTPPSYDREAERRFPVLYLQHGSGESARGWTEQGKAQVILDNLIASGKAVPMIVVMEEGYASVPGAPTGERGRSADAFGDLVVGDLVPMIDATYRTLTTRDSRAIAGLSMGGGQAIKIGLGHSELFSSVGALSGGAAGRAPAPGGSNRPEPIAKAIQDPGVFNEKTQLLFIACGTEDGGFARTKEAHDALEKAGVRHVWFETKGAHEWQVWRKSFYELAQRLFRNPPK